MRKLTHPSRRRFGQGLGVALVLAGLPKAAPAHDVAQVTSVRIEGFAFVPARVEIRAGDSVTWTNADLAPHTATAEDSAWDTGALDKDANGRVTFEAPGVYPYFCAFHPHMRGTVAVLPKMGG